MSVVAPSPMLVVAACVGDEPTPVGVVRDDGEGGSSSETGGNTPGADGQAQGDGSSTDTSTSTTPPWDASHCGDAAPNDFCDSFDNPLLRAPWTETTTSTFLNTDASTSSPTSLLVTVPNASGGGVNRQHYAMTLPGAKGAIIDAYVRVSFNGWTAQPAGRAHILSVGSDNSNDLGGLFVMAEEGMRGGICASTCVQSILNMAKPNDVWTHARVEVRFGTDGYFQVSHGPDAPLRTKYETSASQSGVTVYIGVRNWETNALAVRYDNVFIEALY